MKKHIYIYALHPIFQKFPQQFLWNSFTDWQWPILSFNVIIALFSPAFLPSRRMFVYAFALGLRECLCIHLHWYWENVCVYVHLHWYWENVCVYMHLHWCWENVCAYMHLHWYWENVCVYICTGIAAGLNLFYVTNVAGTPECCCVFTQPNLLVHGIRFRCTITLALVSAAVHDVCQCF